MTKSQSITTANNWAYTVRGNTKSPLTLRFYANEVLTAIEGAQDDPDVAYDSLAALLQRWTKDRKGSLELPIKRLSKALQLDTAETISQS